MVVADEDPPRRRTKLSLKSSKKGDSTPSQDEPPILETAGTALQGPSMKPQLDPSSDDCPPPVLDLSQSDLPCEGSGVPPVASLENLGNTCFLNSVLEVLRYTPCFLEGLEELYRHITHVEKVKAEIALRERSEVKSPPVLSWELIKNTFKMYKKMEKREQMFFQFASADITTMAVKPDKILDNIREFNPMFEGNMQHDAQELLRCLLCYLEDAEEELHLTYTRILTSHPLLLRTPVSLSVSKEGNQKNPIMERFLAAGRNKTRRGRVTSTMTGRENCTEKFASNGVVSDVHIKNTELSFEGPVALSLSDKGSPRPHSSKRKCRVEKDLLDEIDGDALCDSDCTGDNLQSKKQKICEEGELSPYGVNNTGDGFSNTPLSLRVRKMDVTSGIQDRCGDACNSPMENFSEVETGSCKNKTCYTVSKALPNGFVGDKFMKMPLSHKGLGCETAEISSTNCSDGNVAPSPKSISSTTNVLDKNQPTILSLFAKKNTFCRRLGIKGRVLYQDQKLGQHLSPKKESPSRAGAGVPLRMSPRKRDQNSRKLATLPNPAEAKGHGLSMSEQKKGNLIATKSPLKNSGAECWNTSSIASPSKCVSLKDVQRILSLQTCKEKIVSGVSQDNNSVSDSCEKELVSPTDTGKQSSALTELNSTSSHLQMFSKFSNSPAKTVRSSCVSQNETTVTKCHSQRCFQPSQLMIMLEKCDNFYNTSSISASAFMKAVNISSPARRKVDFDNSQNESSACKPVVFSNDDQDTPVSRKVDCKNEDEKSLDDCLINSHDSDCEDDSVHLGAMGSFTSVPLKSVCIKVERCDAVCDSPEKSVNARFAEKHLTHQRVQRFKMMEKLFQGTMMMRTKCMECERCNERKESFQDVSVPLKGKTTLESNEESDEEKDTCLTRLMQAFTEVERLCDDNKYFCDHCLRYVEAERSLHYDVLPNILTVHLKRFSATTGMFSCLSKINDYVTVPLLLSCLRYKCPKPCVRADHRYTLYAIIAHAGSTISAGHYLSYVKVRPNADCSPHGYDSLAAYLNKSSTTATATAGSKNSSDAEGFFTEMPKEAGDYDVNVNLNVPSPVHHGHGDRVEGKYIPYVNSPSEMSDLYHQDGSDYHWLECDDETIHILSEKEFHGRLSEKDGTLRGTPYVLFYHRLDTWRAK